MEERVGPKDEETKAQDKAKEEDLDSAGKEKEEAFMTSTCGGVSAEAETIGTVGQDGMTAR